jgi:hypothetical protein
VGGSSKKPRPSPLQQELEQLQVEELRRQTQSVQELKAFASRRRAGRRSLVFTSGAGIDSGTRVGLDEAGTNRARASVLAGLTAEELTSTLKKRGAITTRRRAPGFQPRFQPGGKGQRAQGGTITTLDPSKL